MIGTSEPTIAQLQSHSLTGVVQREIERAILCGDLLAGERINENALAAKLGVSRGPVREACRGLAELGLVYAVPNRGVFVARLDLADAAEVYDLRAGLVGLAGRLLAPVIDDSQLDELNRMLGDMERAAGEPDFRAFNVLNGEFHDTIVRWAGNGRLTKTYRGLVKEFQLYRAHGLVQADALLTSHKEHQAIVAALAARDAQAAFQVSLDHVLEGKARMMAAVTARGDAPPAAAPARTARQ